MKIRWLHDGKTEMCGVLLSPSAVNPLCYGTLGVVNREMSMQKRVAMSWA
jgi:hypothetical protein